MKVKVMVEKEIDIIYLEMAVNVRHEDDDMPYDYPFRDDGVWKVKIDVGTGQIQNWPGYKAISFDMKVTDEGSYYLIDSNGAVALSIENNYVPNNLVPGEWGDYINMEISATGLIENWPKTPTFEDFMGGLDE